jgi:tetratricopeptide (TPR) repeat protein
MPHRILVVLVVFVSLLVLPAAGQFASNESLLDHLVRVHVSFQDGGGCDSSTKIELLQSESLAASGFTDKNCNVDLLGIAPGAYRLVVSDRGFSGIEAGEITLNRFDSGPIEVQVPRQGIQDEPKWNSTTTSVADLKIPKRAAKEFTKARQAMAVQDWKSAATSLERAVGIYPQYAAAYNNLGIVDARLGDRTKEAKDLQRAIAIDSRYVDAYVNLARMDIAESKFSDAEMALRKANSLGSEDGVILVLLTYAEFMNHHPEDAVKDCRRVHVLNNVPHAFAHWTAAFALEQQNQIAEAAAEFRAFVSEEPAGDRADAARRELANIADYLSRNK